MISFRNYRSLRLAGYDRSRSSYLQDTSAPERKLQTKAPLKIEGFLIEGVKRGITSGAFSKGTLEQMEWPYIERLLTKYHGAKIGFDIFRKSKFPWIINPVAWRTRIQRNAYQAALKRLHETGIARAVN